MKTIKLTRGQVTRVDDEDYKLITMHKWHAALDSGSKTFRAARRDNVNGKSKIVFLARLLLNAPEGMFVDHINGDPLDNRKSNLRLCTKAENGMNRSFNKNNKSGYKGVSWATRDKRWTAHINKTVDGKYKQFPLGNYKSKREAALAYNEAAKLLFGQFARLNKVHGSR